MNRLLNMPTPGPLLECSASSSVFMVAGDSPLHVPLRLKVVLRAAGVVKDTMW